MTTLETSILRILSQRVGRHMALKAQTIAGMLEVDEREVRETIKTLIEVYGHAICSTLDKSYGYFFPKDAEEGYRSVAKEKSRIRKTRERVDALEAALSKKFGPQIGMGI